MKISLNKTIFMAAAAILGAASAKAEYAVDYHGSLLGTFAGGDFAPYYMSANRYGTVTQSANALLRLGASRDIDRSKRFSYGFGADFIGGYGSSADYLNYLPGRPEAPWDRAPESPAPVWVQQLYGEVKYRSLFLSAGMKERGSAMLDNSLSSGDMTHSANARPIPEVRVGFIDFTDIPWINGWVQLQAELSYGKMMDDKYNERRYNYYDYHINTGALYTYKRLYFRTKPSMPFSATFGMQAAGFFGGTTTSYIDGQVFRVTTASRGLKMFLKMLIPTDGGAEYYAGSSLGSWDVALRYRLPGGDQLRAYMQKPFEDGSGIGFMNGFDGLWGLEYKAARKGWISGAVIEYIDLTNQGGPNHWDPDDFPGSTMGGHSSGADNYYNNFEYNSFANYGMSLGTPFVPSPIYNTNGCLQFLNTRVRGFHIGIEGEAGGQWAYRALGGYRKGWGTPFQPLLEPTSSTSVMIEGKYRPAAVKGLEVCLQLAGDKGSMFGDHFGALLGVRYSGTFIFGKK